MAEMKRQAQVNQIPSFYRRWESLEQDRRALSDDLKELFSEAKAFGLNTKALRAVFAERFASATMTPEQRSKIDANEADMDLYRMALDGSPSHACESVNLETGEINRLNSEPITEPSQAHNDVGSGQAAASIPPEVAAGNSECMAPKPLPEPEAYSLGDVETPAEAKSHVQEPSEAEGSGGVQDRCESTPPPHSPETAERGAGPEKDPASDGGGAPPNPSPLPSTQNNEATASDGLHDDRLQGVPDTLSDETGKGGEAGGSLPVAPASLDDARVARALKLRPNCQHPERCRSGIADQHCFTCRQDMVQGKGGAA